LKLRQVVDPFPGLILDEKEMKKVYLCNSFLLILAEKRERFAQISIDNALLWIVIATEGKMITSGLSEV
jgi:hypothetical protein